MKRMYRKPEIMFEDFSLNTHIAGNCRYITDLPTQGACAYETDRGLVVFITETMGCATTAPNGEFTSGNNTICYHVPSADFNVFNS